MATVVTPDGQVAIPKAMQERLGLKPGSLVDLELSPDGALLIRPAKPASAAKGRFDALRGSSTSGLTTDEIMSMTRGED
ncbi:AbrB/MazE/SpoVT family DNA-binding domain-containing protein [Indioceanicola profundi]|uniref:AbrB/MazE/SpoVT family DNA-binding domain-containing protein n=1 Tax=Indioceanicola profundi TaxID=2220096 RepID=UPI000E6ACEC9|nr:AbrB/MazE/SpoVT family DNA-binding domain-containing protein [Indioceanicola profundi]